MANTLVIPVVNSSPTPTGSGIPVTIGNTSVNTGVVQDLTYPPEMTSGIRMVFSFYQYQRTSPFTPTNFQQINDWIFLALPDGLMESYTVTYEALNPGPLAAVELPDREKLGKGIASTFATPRGFIDTFAGTGDALISGLKGSVSSAYNRFKNSPNFNTNLGFVAMDAVARSGVFAGISSDLGGIVSNYFGTAVNPNSTVSLKAPVLRQHHFTWTFAPKSLEESNIIQQIKNRFETHMLPQTDITRFFLNYADIVLPEFIGTDADDLAGGNYLYTFKPCFITSFSINPAAGGRPAFFNKAQYGSPPAIITMDMILQEIMLFTKTDVGQTAEKAFQQDIGSNNAVDPLSSDDLYVLPTSAIP